MTRNLLFLLDSGGQYRDGTTDVTRTVHFGEPSAEEKRSYTRVLQGRAYQTHLVHGFLLVTDALYRYCA